MIKTRKVAIWIRVSTEEQTTENQRIALETFCKHRGWEIVKEYDLTGVSAYRNKHEQVLRQAQKDGRANQFDTLLVWALDRLSRQGAEGILRLVREFDEYGVQVVSIQEEWLEQSDPFIRQILLAIIGWVGKFESERLSERTKSGLRRAKERGVKLGRPKKVKKEKVKN